MPAGIVYGYISSPENNEDTGLGVKKKTLADLHPITEVLFGL